MRLILYVQSFIVLIFSSSLERTRELNIQFVEACRCEILRFQCRNGLQNMNSVTLILLQDHWVDLADRLHRLLWRARN